MPKRQKVILDTDIGDDIDDAMALALICASPELELVGVTTVFGNVAARARQARTVLCKCGEKFRSVPVAVGCGASMASRPKHNIDFYLRDELPNQDGTCMAESELPPVVDEHAVNFLIRTIMDGDGDIVPILIGAMTNLAAAMVMERRIVKKIPKLVVMAAEFRHHMAEWNIACDPEAAHIIYSSGIPIDSTTWYIGDKVTFRDSDLAKLNAMKLPIAQNLSAAIKAWQTSKHIATTPMPHLYDPMAIATIMQPDLVTWKTGTVHVELSGATTYGFTTFKEDPAGIHRVAWETDRDRCLNYYLNRIAQL